MVDMNQQLCRLLSNSGFAPTKNRILVLSKLYDAKRPITQEEIRNSIPGSDKVTIYRTLNRLVELGIARKFEEAGKSYFELVLDFHAHFICEKCKKIECIDSDVQSLLPSYKVTNAIFYGLCPECSS